MNRAVSAACLVVGVLLVFWGVSARNSFNSDVSRAFTGQPTDKAMWLMGGGAALSVIGIAGIARGRKKS